MILQCCSSIVLLISLLQVLLIPHCKVELFQTLRRDKILPLSPDIKFYERWLYKQEK